MLQTKPARGVVYDTLSHSARRPETGSVLQAIRGLQFHDPPSWTWGSRECFWCRDRSGSCQGLLAIPPVGVVAPGGQSDPRGLFGRARILLCRRFLLPGGHSDPAPPFDRALVADRSGKPALVNYMVDCRTGDLRSDPLLQTAPFNNEGSSRLYLFRLFRVTLRTSTSEYSTMVLQSM